MEFSKREADAITIFDVTGEIDVYNAGALKNTLIDEMENGKSRIILNMKRVSYIDSTGIGVLLWALPALQKRQGDLKLLSLSDSIRKVFRLTNLTKFFEIFEDEAAATAAFKKNSP